MQYVTLHWTKRKKLKRKENKWLVKLKKSNQRNNMLSQGDIVLFNGLRAEVLGFMKNGEICISVGLDVMYVKRESLTIDG